MSYINQLREEFAKVQAEAHKVLETASKESRGLTNEEKESQDKRFARMDAIKGICDDQVKFAGLALSEGKAILPKDPEGKAEFDASEGRQVSKYVDNSAFDVDGYTAALKRFAQTGHREKFTITTSTGSGAWLPKQVLQPESVRRLQNSFRAVLAAYGLQPMTISQVATFSLPIGDDTANVGQNVSEGATSGTALDPTDASLSISPTLWDSKAFWYSNTEVETGVFDVVAYTLPMAQKRIEKFQESGWTTAIKAGTVGKTLAATTAITYAELLDWEHSLAPAYRTDAAFLVSDSFYKALRGLVDDNHRPIMDLDPTNAFQAKIHGKPVFINDYLDSFIANKIVGAFVSAEAIKIVDVANARLARYTNYSERPDQIGFQMFVNGDMKFVTTGLALVKTAIS